MTVKNSLPFCQLEAYQKLKNHYQQLQPFSLKKLFQDDPQRAKHFTLQALDIYFDYSKHLVTHETLQLLVQLARESGLEQAMQKMFQGEKINLTENRAALHTALRLPKEKSFILNNRDRDRDKNKNISSKIHTVLNKMAVFADKIRTGKYKGHTGKPIRNIINIGIGGSYLGPVMVDSALKYYGLSNLVFRFISNIDNTDFTQAVQGLDPEETLFIISSKTFTTLETMTNAQSAREWLLNQLKHPSAVPTHLAAVTACPERALEFGISGEQLFEFWDWVGGRYSLTSAIGLINMIAIGSDHFDEMLKGFHEMDEHFRTIDFEHNIPVLMGLLTIWYNNFFDAQTMAVLPYDQYLKYFPAYLQQLTMESNGKQTSLNGHQLDYQTSPVYWGEIGTNGQHSFFQMLHQGTKLIPCDFIAFMQPLNASASQHEVLLANMFAQSEALAFGKIQPALAPHRTFKGNRPSSTFLLEKLTPFALGKLIALYEHSVFVQSVIWQINPFDQWGVELGKALAEKIVPELNPENKINPKHDSSTNYLIEHYQKFRNSKI